MAAGMSAAGSRRFCERPRSSGPAILLAEGLFLPDELSRPVAVAGGRGLHAFQPAEHRQIRCGLVGIPTVDIRHRRGSIALGTLCLAPHLLFCLSWGFGFAARPLFGFVSGLLFGFAPGLGLGVAVRLLVGLSSGFGFTAALLLFCFATRLRFCFATRLRFCFATRLRFRFATRPLFRLASGLGFGLFGFPASS